MQRIWARTMVNGKIEKSFIYESVDNFNEKSFFKHLEKICQKIDIPTPIILKSHIENYVDFNNVTFLPRDFVEYVDFEKLILENATLDK